MTREEAIENIKFLKQFVVGREWNEALNMAIEALQEPEIVHCKDCKYWTGAYEIRQCGLAGYLTGEKGYCLYGKAGEQE